MVWFGLVWFGLVWFGLVWCVCVSWQFMYIDRDGNYHAVFHLLYNTRPADSLCGTGRFLGGHAFSPAGDGRKWTFTGVAYDGNISYTVRP